MQMTIRNIPEEVKRRLLEHARMQRKSLNQAAVDALAAHTGYAANQRVQKRDLSFMTATAEDISTIEQTVKQLDAADVKAQRTSNRSGHQSIQRRPRPEKRGRSNRQ